MGCCNGSPGPKTLSLYPGWWCIFREGISRHMDTWTDLTPVYIKQWSLDRFDQLYLRSTHGIVGGYSQFCIKKFDMFKQFKVDAAVHTCSASIHDHCVKFWFNSVKRFWICTWMRKFKNTNLVSCLFVARGPGVVHFDVYEFPHQVPFLAKAQPPETQRVEPGLDCCRPKLAHSDPGLGPSLHGCEPESG